MSECKYYQELISRMLDRDLSKQERAAVMEHLDSCSECAAMYEAFSMLSNNVSANLVEAPEELTEDIMANIRRSEMIRKNRKTSRQLKTIIAAAACVAVLVAVVGGFTVIGNLRKQNTVYELPRLSESNISVDPASGSTSADGMTEAAVAGTNTNTGNQSNLPPIQFGETVVSSSASVQQGETVLATFPPTPVPTQNTWYGNNSQQSTWYGNNQQSVPVQQPVQVQQQPVQVQQQPSGNIVVLPAPSTAPSSITVVPAPTPTPTPEPSKSPVFGFPFFSFLKPQEKQPDPTEPPAAVSQQTYVEPEQTYVEYEEPEVEYEEPEVEYEEPEVEYEEPEVEYEEPYVEYEEPYVEAEEPYVEPEESYVEYEEPYVEYEEPYVEYEEPYVEPEQPYVEPEQPVVEEPLYEEQSVVGDPLYEEPPVEEEIEPAEESVEESSEPVRVDLTDKDTDEFIAALLGISDEEAAVPAEENFSADSPEFGQAEFTDGAEFASGEFTDGAGFEEAFPAAVEQPSAPWDEILPDDTDADRTDILLYRHIGEDCELEIRLYGDDVYLIYDDENDSKTCMQAEYDADTYKAALEAFVSGDSDAAVQLLTEPQYF